MTSPKTSHIKSNNKKKILLVDDEPDLTSLFKMALEYAGFNVDTFNDPTSALVDFQPNLYDLVILDIVMPHMSGLELYEELKKVDPNVKICFLTAREKYHEELRKEQEEEYCALSKDLFIQKPITNEDLIREVKERINPTT